MKNTTLITIIGIISMVSISYYIYSIFTGSVKVEDLSMFDIVSIIVYTLVSVMFIRKLWLKKIKIDET